MASLSNCYIPLPILPPNLHQKPKISRCLKPTQNNKQQKHPSSSSSSSSSSSLPKPSRRTTTTLRPIHIATQILSQSSGSCLLELGCTKVLVSVHGPRSIPASSISMDDSKSLLLDHNQGAISCHVRYAPIFGKHSVTSAVTQARTLDLSRSLHQTMMEGGGSSSGTGGGTSTSESFSNNTNELELSQRLKDALLSSVLLEKFPKCVVDINVMILQADGSVFSAAIVASSLALVDAGIECYDVVSACTVAVVESMDVMDVEMDTENKEEKEENEEEGKGKNQYTCIADPTEGEMLASKGVVTLAMLGNSREVTYWDVEGRLPSKTVQNALDICKNGCHTVHKFMRESLIHSESS